MKIDRSSFGWLLYDFGNSIVAVIGGIYFSLWFIEDLQAGSLHFNLLLAFSGLVIFLLGPITGITVSRYGLKRSLILSTIISVAAVTSLIMASVFLRSDLLIYFVSIAYIVFLISFQVSRIAHNIFLGYAFPSNQQSRLSGLGSFANWTGSIFGILFSIPIIILFDDFGRQIAILASGLLFGICSFIAIRKLDFSGIQTKIRLKAKEETTFKSFFGAYKKVGILLVAYFLIFDSMITIQKNLPPFLGEVHDMVDKTQAIAFLLILISAAFGGLYSSRKITKSNSRKSIGIFALVLSCAVIMTLFSGPYLWISFLMAGFSYGSLEAAIRTNVLHETNQEDISSTFGILAGVEKVSGIIGPLIWSIPFVFLSTEWENRSYKLSMLSMSALLILGYLVVYCLKAQDKKSRP